MLKLSNAQMSQYLRDSYIVVETGLPAEFHQDLFRKTEEVFEKEGNPGNNLLPRMPEVGRILSDPAVAGVFAGILGDDYYLQPHRHCHFRPPGGADQILHMDSFRRQRHRTRHALAFYYPQDTTLDMGPTAVVPGSHYYNTRHAALDGSGEVMVEVKAGSVVIANYDIWHRGTGNRSEKHRYMMKFLLARMSEPKATSSNGGGMDDIGRHGPSLMRHMWSWHMGEANGHAPSDNGGPVDSLADLVANGSEPDAMDAAYRLGAMGERSVPALMDLLAHESGQKWWERKQLNVDPEGMNSPCMNASYGLSAAGRAAVPALVDRAADSRWWQRAFAAETLGDIGPAASEAVPCLAELAAEDNTIVRAEAVHALGIAGQRGTDAVPALARALTDESSLVRTEASLALARIGARAKAATPALIAALEDEDRYVRGNSVHALYRIDTPGSRDALLRHLMAARWCHSTVEGSLF